MDPTCALGRLVDTLVGDARGRFVRLHGLFELRDDKPGDEDTEDDYAYYTEEEYDTYHVDGASSLLASPLPLISPLLPSIFIPFSRRFLTGIRMSS